MTDRLQRSTPPTPTDPDLERPLEFTLGAVLFFALAVYAKFPRLDLWVSQRQFHPEHGFALAQAPLAQALDAWAPRLILALLTLPLVWLVISPLLAALAQRRGHARWARHMLGLGRRTAILTLLLTLMGPGLLGEGLLKHTMGRPRPVQTDLFGGTQGFLGPFEIGDNPAEHRSFFSTTAAAGFSLMGLGLACGPVWRRRWLLIGLLVGGVLGLMRVMQGAHYLSDVIFAFYAVWLLALGLSWTTTRWFPPRPE